MVIALLATLIYRLVPDDRFDITMRTAMVAGGVVDGSTMVINGAEAGTVREVIADGPDSFRVVLDLTPSLVDKPGLRRRRSERDRRRVHGRDHRRESRSDPCLHRVLPDPVGVTPTRTLPELSGRSDGADHASRSSTLVIRCSEKC